MSPSATWRCVVAEVKRPRPLSLAAGIGYLTIGSASIISSWSSIDAGAVGAIALLLAGLAALVSLSTRRAPHTSGESE